MMKLVFDTLEVAILRMSTFINEMLIRLSWDKSKKPLEEKFVKAVLSILRAFQSISFTYKRKEEVIVYNLEYTFKKF